MTKFLVASMALFSLLTSGCMPGTMPSQSTSASDPTPTQNSSSAGGTSPSPNGTATPIEPLTFDQAAALIDITRPDGSACRSVTDGGLLSNASLMAQLALTMGGQALADSLQSDAQLQPKLDKIRPQLRELAKRVVWLPQATEVLIGQQIFRLAPRPVYRPANERQRKLVNTVLTPIFEAMRAYATDELKTDLKFTMRLFSDDTLHSPEMIPGGILLVPSGMIKTLASSGRDTSQVVAFMFAHEFSHALRRHITKSTQARLVDGLLMADVFKQSFKGFPMSLDAISGLPQMFDLSEKTIGSAMKAVCGAEKWFTEFDQKQELEADVCGALLLTKVPAQRPYSAIDGLTQYRKIMAALPPARAATTTNCVVAATHPEPAEREKNLEQYQRKLSPAPR